ncbi:unnamed protein product [Rhizophagus irregularis]|nr:unnamed protein product [Rhizophagus irregularis]
MLKTSLINDRSSHIRREGEKLEKLYPTSHEWKIIKEMVELLSPFESVTCLLSGATYPTIGLIYPSLCNLKEILETEFILSFETDVAENCLDFVSQETREEIINQLEIEYEVLKNDSIPSIPVKSNLTLTTMGSFWKKKNERNVTPIKNKVQYYLNLPELPAFEEYDSFTW